MVFRLRDLERKFCDDSSAVRVEADDQTGHETHSFCHGSGSIVSSVRQPKLGGRDLYLSGVNLKRADKDFAAVDLVDLKLAKPAIDYVEQNANRRPACVEGPIIVTAFDRNSLFYLSGRSGRSKRKTALLVDLANAHRLHLSGERVSASEFNREKVRKKSSLALR